MTRHSKRACSALAIPKSVKFSYRIGSLCVLEKLLRFTSPKELSLLVMYPYLLKRKFKLTVRSITQCRDDITTLLLVLLVCMENIFKELFLHHNLKGCPSRLRMQR